MKVELDYKIVSFSFKKTNVVKRAGFIGLLLTELMCPVMLNIRSTAAEEDTKTWEVLQALIKFSIWLSTGSTTFPEMKSNERLIRFKTYLQALIRLLTKILKNKGFLFTLRNCNFF